MYKIGIIGSGPERFSDQGKVRRVIGQTIDLLALQYGEDEVMFNIRSDIGVGLWAAEECIDRDYKYHLFLPYSLEKTSEHWYDDQKRMLANQYIRAHSLTISQPTLESEHKDESHDMLIDDSNFLVCFWSGAKQGAVFDTIKTALEHNRMVLDGFNELKLITNKDLRKNTLWKKE